MRTTLLVLAALSVLSAPAVASVSEEERQLAVCFTDSLNGKERKYLARWIFFGIASHSSIKQYANVTPQDVDESNQYVAGLIMRLLTEDCLGPAKAARASAGRQAWRHAFRVMGGVAMQELTNDSATRDILEGFEAHLDWDAYDKTFK